MKTSINVNIACENLQTLDLAVSTLTQMLQDAADYMTALAKKDNLKIDILSD